MNNWRPHLLGLVAPTMTLAVLIVGSWWMGLTILTVLVLYPIIESLTGKSSNTDPLQEGKAHTAILHMHGVLVPVIVAALLWRVSLDGLTLPVGLGVVSAGLSTGGSGIVAAHELGHRRLRSPSWWLARVDLLSVLYLHFTVEHNHTHHRHWARPVDPTSSPWGRSLYFHVLRTVPLQLQGAMQSRPSDTKRSLAIEALLLAGLYFVNPLLLIAFVGQAAIAIFLVEYVNYLQHHGLERGPDERPNATHAWESRHRWSRWTLLELPLHPSHHLKASTPYHRLDAHDEAPQLPFGYYVMFWAALIPPVFNRIMRANAPE
jgi:alkane 1-monooxygenase